MFELYTGMTLGTVQSVTFDAVARELVVLDRVAGRLPGTADLRLVRIDAFGRGARVVQTWRQDGPCSRYHLLVDGRGRLVLAGSKDRDLAHAVYVLSGESKSFTSRRLAAAPGTLASVPWSNEKVVYMPVEDASTGAVNAGSHRPRGRHDVLRTATLSLDPARASWPRAARPAIAAWYPATTEPR